MRCPWNEFLAILPPRLRKDVDAIGKKELRELRLRLNAPPELVLPGGSTWLTGGITAEELKQCVNTASRYSPWNAASVGEGYLTAPGGHRIGLCGEAVVKNGEMNGFREITSLCIRVARDYPGIAGRAAALKGSVLILGAPGSGKTTLLRDLIRQLSEGGEHVTVVDERGELFHPESKFHRGKCTDVLTGCGKGDGIGIVLRTMGPDCIAVDEITAREDCDAMLRAGWCGVRLLATVHASSVTDLQSRTDCRMLTEYGLFPNVITLRKDKTWYLERMNV